MMLFGVRIVYATTNDMDKNAMSTGSSNIASRKWVSVICRSVNSLTTNANIKSNMDNEDAIDVCYSLN